MSSLNDPLEVTADGVPAVRLAERADAEHPGASLYELQPATRWSSTTTSTARSC
jgi:hypothetical protein